MKSIRHKCAYLLAFTLTYTITMQIRLRICLSNVGELKVISILRFNLFFHLLNNIQGAPL